MSPGLSAMIAASPAATGALVAIAAALAFAIDRLLRRARRLVELRRAHQNAGPAAAYAAARLLIALLRGGVWLGFVWLAGEISPSLRFARTFVSVVGHTAITAPVFMLNQRGYSILDAIELPIAVFVAWLAVRYAVRIADSRLAQSGRFDAGTRDTISLLGRCLLGFAAALIILRAYGVDMSSLTIGASVVGVGIGFGLQNITSNFVSGLLVSLERPIRPGDFVKVGDLMGTVQRIGARCTEIVTLDRVSILVPNSHFLEKEVVNWSHGDPVYRLHVPVGVAYGSDVPTVRAALLHAAQGHRAVLRDPKPTVDFEGFGASALEFELMVWARDPKQQGQLLSDLNYRVEASLRAQGIEIPFPQLDVRVRAVHGSRPFEADDYVPGPPNGARTPFNGDGDGREPSSLDALSGAYDEVCDARAWTDEEMDALVERMRGEDGVPVADRRHRLRSYPRCFVGRDAVDWLVHELEVSRQEALEIGRALMAHGVFHHVLHEHALKDGQFFYRFRADETR